MAQSGGVLYQTGTRRRRVRLARLHLRLHTPWATSASPDASALRGRSVRTAEKSILLRSQHMRKLLCILIIGVSMASSNTVRPANNLRALPAWRRGRIILTHD